MKTPLCLQNILPGVEMPSFQLGGLTEVFTNNKMLLAFDTGTGKTFTYAGIVRGLLNRNPDKKHLLVIINDSIPQVPNDVRSLTSVATESFDGTSESSARLKFFWDRTSIFCFTLEALRIPGVVLFLFKHLLEIESLTIDEAHHVSNWGSSDTAFMIRALAREIPFVVELSATPMTSESKQYYRLLNVLDRNISPYRDETRFGKYVNRYMPVNRDDYGLKGDYTPTLVKVTPTIDQMKKQKGIVFRHLKGTGAIPQVNALIETVASRLCDGKRVLIYMHYHDTREWVEKHLKEANIPYTSLHGRVVGKAEKQIVLDRFRNHEVDVLVTSVTESLNIEADVVIFYEFTTSVKQVIGRAHRGLRGKRLEIVFILTEDTDEIEYFLKYIYARSLTVQRLLGKDYSEIVEIGREVEQMSLE